MLPRDLRNDVNLAIRDGISEKSQFTAQTAVLWYFCLSFTLPDRIDGSDGIDAIDLFFQMIIDVLCALFFKL